MKVLNTILTVAITLTAFNSLAGVYDNNESRLACYQYTYQASSVKRDLYIAQKFSQVSVGSSVKPSLQDNEKILASMFAKRNEMTKSIEKNMNLRAELKKHLSVISAVVPKPNPWAQVPSSSNLSKKEIEIRDLLVQIDSLDKRQVSMTAELESLNKQIEKQKLLLSSSSVDDVQESRIAIERKAYFSQRAVDLEKELSKLQGLIRQLCKYNVLSNK